MFAVKDRRSEQSLLRIRSVANYQFGRYAGTRLFPRNVRVTYSEKTGRIRYVHLDDQRLATLRPTDGLFSLSLDGAKRLLEATSKARRNVVVVRNEVSDFIRKGGDVFAAHVTRVSDEVRSKDEIIVADEKMELLAVGRAVLSGQEMRAFKRGVAVKVRRGVLEEI